jgi:hypothetical protein
MPNSFKLTNEQNKSRMSSLGVCDYRIVADGLYRVRLTGVAAESKETVQRLASSLAIDHSHTDFFQPLLFM